MKSGDGGSEKRYVLEETPSALPVLVISAFNIWNVPIESYAVLFVVWLKFNVLHAYGEVRYRKVSILSERNAMRGLKTGTNVIRMNIALLESVFLPVSLELVR